MRRAITLLLVSAFALTGCASMGPTAEELAGAAKINTELGVNYMRQGRLQHALGKLEKALEQDPTFSPAHNAIAVLYEQLDEMPLAEKHYQKAVEHDPANADALNNFGRFLCIRDRFDEADALFVRGSRILTYPNPEVILTNAGQCALKAENKERADTYFRRALRSNPRFPPALLAMAQTSYDLGRYLSARGYLQRFIEVSRHTPQSLWVGILVEEKLEDRDAVSSYKLNLLANFPDSDEAHRLQDRAQK